MSWILCAENAVTFAWVAKAILYLASLLLFLHSISHLTARMSLSWSHQASKPKISSDSCHLYSDPQSLPVTEMSVVCQSPRASFPSSSPDPDTYLFILNSSPEPLGNLSATWEADPHL